MTSASDRAGKAGSTALPSWEDLVREGLDAVQLLAGRGWTNFGASDPGVTILHQLCFGLGELNYRLGLPAENLVAGADESAASAFPTPLEALTRDPITRDDQRRLLIDRLPGLANAWLEPQKDETGEPTGVQAIFLYPAPDLPGVHAEARPVAGLPEQAARLFRRIRPLGEDVGRVAVMRPAATRVEAIVELDGSVPPEAVVADALIGLSCWLTPEARRVGLEKALASGRPLGPPWRGPALARGLIDLPPPARRRLDLDAVRIRLAGVRGILAVERVDVSVDGERLRPGEAVELEAGRYFSLDGGLERDEPDLVPTLSGEPQQVDSREVLARLRDYWADRRGLRDLPAEFGQSRIAGRAPDLSRLPSTASGLPAVYGVAVRGLPAGAPPERSAQAKQLSFYLGLFDYLIAGMNERLADLGALMRAGPTDRLPSRPLIEMLPELGPLLRPDEAGLVELYFLDAAERIADLVLALRGEDELVIPIPPALSAEAAQVRRIRVKRDLAQALARAARSDEGDLEAAAPAVVGAAEKRCRILLGCRGHFERGSRPLLMIADHVVLGGARPMSATALVHLPDPAWDRAPFRAAVGRMVRANVPAHVAVETLFVDRAGLVAFSASYRRRLRGHWRCAEPWVGDMVERLDGWRSASGAG
ncbi:MAG TPA: hypothetical protein VFQ67_16335 [Allosphingosinicella sp.]|jgi:hypothetical protein|nr:hypothetical protein [Allosphingosinicella sp.]